MIKLLYSIKDVKSGLFTGLMPSINDNTICRDAAILANDKNTVYGQYPGDFDLYCIGELNDQTGDIKPDIRHVINLSSLVKVGDSDVRS